MQYEEVTWEEVESFIHALASIVKVKKVTGVYGPARGGLPLAVMLSHACDIPLLSAPFKNCVIVDDIADTGQTLGKYAGKKFFIATMYYHPDCVFQPDFYQKVKQSSWIVFPWEKVR